jgi:calcineurin-like phosphoesterase family protein
MAIFFTSDTHFGHGGALGLYRRPFASVSAMNGGLIERWNAVVEQNDVVWHMGDFAIRQPYTVMAEFLARLHGHKQLLTGNNDTPATIELEGWDSAQSYAEIVADGKSLVLCHYPFRTWRGIDKGWVNLHGHCHGRLKPMPRQFDVGVDVWGFRPVTLAEILGSRQQAKRGL